MNTRQAEQDARLNNQITKGAEQRVSGSTGSPAPQTTAQKNTKQVKNRGALTFFYRRYPANSGANPPAVSPRVSGGISFRTEGDFVSDDPSEKFSAMITTGWRLRESETKRNAKKTATQKSGSAAYDAHLPSPPGRTRDFREPDSRGVDVFQALAKRCVLRLIWAMKSRASALSMVFSQSLAGRRRRPGQAKVRSTTRLQDFTPPLTNFLFANQEQSCERRRSISRRSRSVY